MQQSLSLTPGELTRALQHLIPLRLPVLIVGGPGLGKSGVTEQATAAIDHDLIIEHPAISDPTDFKGFPALVDGGAEFLPFGNLRRLMDADRPTVCFIDDLGQASPAVQAALMQLLLAREINGKRISDHVSFIAATNRKEDRAGVSGILEPVKSRFAVIVNLRPSLSDWLGFMGSRGYGPMVPSFLQFKPGLLHDWKPSGEIVNQPTPRTWEFCAQIADSNPPAELETVMYAGAVGEAAAIELTAFARIYRGLPDMKAILVAPETQAVPTDPATLYAVMGALVQHVDAESLGRAFEYVDRVPAEFRMLFARNLGHLRRDLITTKHFTAWTTRPDNYKLFFHQAN